MFCIYDSKTDNSIDLTLRLTSIALQPLWYYHFINDCCSLKQFILLFAINSIGGTHSALVIFRVHFNYSVLITFARIKQLMIVNVYNNYKDYMLCCIICVMHLIKNTHVLINVSPIFSIYQLNIVIHLVSH